MPDTCESPKNSSENFPFIIISIFLAQLNAKSLSFLHGHTAPFHVERVCDKEIVVIVIHSVRRPRDVIGN